MTTGSGGCDPSDDGAPGASSARRRARALVDGMVVGQAERARSWAATLGAVADLVDALSAPDGLTGPLSGRADGAGALTATGGARAGSPAASRARHRARARTARAHATGDPVEAAVAEVALALHLTTTAAAHLVDQALALTTDLTRTLAALATGATDEARAKVVVDGTAHLSAAAARRVDDLLQPAELAGLTTAELRARVRHLAAVVEPAEQAARTREGVCARGVRLLPLDDGLAELRATGPALDLASAFDALTGAARARSGPHGRTDPHAALAAGVDPLVVDPSSLPDRRGVDARRFDALVDVLVRPPTGTGPAPTTGRSADEDAGAADGPAVHPAAVEHAGAHGGRCHGPQVVVAMTSLLGLDDEPAQLAGVGPVPAAHLVEHLRDHPFRRAFTDPTSGRLVALDGHLLRAAGGPNARSTATVPLPGLRRVLGEDSPTVDGAAGTGSSSTSPPSPTSPPTTPPPTRPRSTETRYDDRVADGVTAAAPAVTEPVDATATATEPASQAPTATEPAGRTPTTSPPGAPTPTRSQPGEAAHGETGSVGSEPPPHQTSPDGPAPRARPGTTTGARERRRGAPARPRLACPVAAAGGGPYTPSAATQRHLRAARTRCAFPGCRVPADRCDLDHVQPYATGGPTCPCNLHPLCRRHHLAKHRFGWRVRRPAGGSGPTRWTSPLGQTATTRAEPLLPPATPATPASSGASAIPASQEACRPEPAYPAHDAGVDDARWTRSSHARDRAERREGERQQEERRGVRRQHQERRGAARQQEERRRSESRREGRGGERQQEGGDPRPVRSGRDPAAPPDSWSGGAPPF